MTTPRRVAKTPVPNLMNLPMPAGADSGSKWLITAMLVAGKDGCECDSCKLLKRFGGAMSEAMLKEETGSGNTDIV